MKEGQAKRETTSAAAAHLVHALDAQRPHDLHRRLPLLNGEQRLHLHADLDDLHGVGRDHLLSLMWACICQ